MVDEAPVEVSEAPAPSAPSDPFALDEVKLSSLSPEQRAALDPIFDEWKGKAKAEIERTTKTYTEKYRPYEEKANALDQLVKDPRFIQWWQNVQQATGAPEKAEMRDFASPEEWQQAVADAYSGNGAKLKEIQARMFAAMATPVVQELRKSQEELKNAQEEFQMTQAVKDLFERHPDAKELDAIGRDPNDSNSESLLEMCLNWADENGKPLEEGYKRASSWAAALKVGAQQQAMGIVQEKKGSTVSGPTTAKGGTTSVIEVADSDELMQRNMEAILAGEKPPRFVIRQGVANGSRWAQKA